MHTYLLVKWLHVLSAIAVVGLHITYGVWIVRAYGHRSALPFTLRTIRLLDNWLALPAFAILPVSGSAMVALGGISLRTPWLLAGIALFVLLILMHVLLYRPTLADLSSLAEHDRPDAGAFRVAVDRERSLGLTMVLIMVSLVLVMVLKPRLWG